MEEEERLREGVRQDELDKRRTMIAENRGERRWYFPMHFLQSPSRY